MSCSTACPKMTEASVSPAERPGIAFEKAVAAIQAQLDPAATVAHSEILIDRLGHKRQFDVVVRGSFAGQTMLGVIECKDVRKPVGTPAVDAFVTKAANINANFKILMSRRGFTEPALAECKHYGIQPLSLISDDPANRNFFVGTRWNQIKIRPVFAASPIEAAPYNAEDVKIQGKKVLDWFTNHLLDIQSGITDFGWVVGISAQFENPQMVAVREGEEYLCTAIEFFAERICDKRERRVGISGTGFFNWQKKQATFAPGSTIVTDAVPTDFMQWESRTELPKESSGFLEFRLIVQAGLKRVADAIDLDRL
jgi:hypothetical protein